MTKCKEIDSLFLVLWVNTFFCNPRISIWFRKYFQIRRFHEAYFRPLQFKYYTLYRIVKPVC